MFGGQTADVQTSRTSSWSSYIITRFLNSRSMNVNEWYQNISACCVQQWSLNQQVWSSTKVMPCSQGAWLLQWHKMQQLLGPASLPFWKMATASLLNYIWQASQSWSVLNKSGNSVTKQDAVINNPILQPLLPGALAAPGSSAPSEAFDGSIDLGSMDCAKIMEFVYVSRCEKKVSEARF